VSLVRIGPALGFVAVRLRQYKTAPSSNTPNSPEIAANGRNLRLAPAGAVLRALRAEFECVCPSPSRPADDAPLVDLRQHRLTAGMRE
jgi:hypothetical protein